MMMFVESLNNHMTTSDKSRDLSDWAFNRFRKAELASSAVTETVRSKGGDSSKCQRLRSMRPGNIAPLGLQWILLHVCSKIFVLS